MTLTQLEYIIAVDTHRHFAIAAEACHVTQPTLSMQIKKLETDLGVVIFDRSRQPIVPTEAGQKIIAQARIAVQEAALVRGIFKEGSAAMEGAIHLGVIPTIAPTLLPRFIDKLAKKYPKLEIRVQEATTASLTEMLHHDRIDAAIMATPLSEKGLVESPLYYEPFMAYIPDGHRLANEAFILTSELDINDLLLLNEGHCFRNSVLQMCHADTLRTDRQIQLESGSFETLIKLSRKGLGMTLIPYLKALEMKGQKDRERIAAFAPPRPLREVSMVYRKARLKLPIIQAIEAVIKDAVPEKLRSMPQEGVIQNPV